MSLQEEINTKSKEIHTDGYLMSIGELMNLYQSDELDIHPEFQRFFRWNHHQKTKLIESILLGIPIPSIFVSQRKDGVWDVIDGLQRLSTIFEFVGSLKDEDKNLLPPIQLVGTDYLPSLEGKYWQKEDDPDHSFTISQRINFKRAKFDIKIIKETSDPDTKYELFQRLNTGGTHLSDQEVRNCLMVMTNQGFFQWIKELSKYPAFQNCISLPVRLQSQQYDVELVCRFLALKNTDDSDLRRIKSLGQFLDKKIIEFCKRGLNLEKEEIIFKKTFDCLEQALSERSFKRYYPDQDRSKGPFYAASFEVIAVGLGLAIESNMENPYSTEELISKVKALWSHEGFKETTGSGSKSNIRIPKMRSVGQELFVHG